MRNIFGGLFDFDGNGRIDEADSFLGSILSNDLYAGNKGVGFYAMDDEDEEDAEYDPFGAQDYANAREFYEDNSGDFSDYEEAEDYYEDWG